MSSLRLALAQLPVAVGDLAGNTARVAGAMRWAEQAGADLLLTPEMTVTGYPVEDLLSLPDFLTAAAAATGQLAAGAGQTLTLLGVPLRTGDLPPAGGAGDATAPLDSLPRPVRNVAAVLHQGQVVAAAAKRRLPTYLLFDDARHFSPGPERTVLLDVAGITVAVLICEDLWDPAVSAQAVADGAQVLVTLNASPYYVGKPALREQLVQDTARRLGVTVAYVNAVGGQDEIVFDGNSLIAGPDGALLVRAAAFVADRVVLDVPVGAPRPVRAPVAARTMGGRADRPALTMPALRAAQPVEAEVYGAAVLGLRDYFAKTGFDRAVLGLSGGIDSALVAVIAADALGPENVWGVALPGPYSSEHSVSDARELAANVGMRFDVVDIGGGYGERLAALNGLLTGPDGTVPAGAAVGRENLQARLRAVTLMTLANTHNLLLLTTGNKSESAVGYMTIGGDALGTSPNPVGDCPKTTVRYADGTVMPGVYALAAWRNAHAVELGQSPPIPTSTLTKAPSAELAPDQHDSDSLPPYEILDPLLAAFLEEHATPDQLVALVASLGVAPVEADLVVRRVLRLIEVSEWKRRQGVPRIKLTRLSFGRDRRMPLASAWRSAPSTPVPV